MALVNAVLTNSGFFRQPCLDQDEFDGMVSSAMRRLQDAAIVGLSDEGRFSLAYGAAHALALASIRWHGYRSENRYLVFQCLQYTLARISHQAAENTDKVLFVVEKPERL